MTKHHYKGDMLSVAEIAEIKNITPSTLYGRSARNPGLTYEELAEGKTSAGCKRTSNYPSIVKIAKALGMPYQRLRNRIKTHGFQAAVEMDPAIQTTGMRENASCTRGNWQAQISPELEYDEDLELRRRVQRYIGQGLSADQMLQLERRAI